MDGAFHHVSVMPEETVGGLLTTPAGIYVDCTLGGAGHALRIASRLLPEGRLIGLDRDADAVAEARRRLGNVACQVDVVHENFSRLDEVLGRLGVDAVDGVLFDLGVSSHQIDTAERGFSYMHDAPLDMRMDARQKLTAYEIVNTYAEADLARIFFAYGEERWGKRIAAFIAETRQKAPVRTTAELVDVICRAVPKAVRRAAGGHPAKRVFQAIRIEANDELSILDASIRAAVRRLRPGGRIAVLTFHSLEDRIVKAALRELSRDCVCPPGLPVCVCGHKREIRLLGKARTPGAEEMKGNPRAKSAKLRLAEKEAEQ